MLFRSRQAMTDMILIGMADDAVISGWSTFGNVAVGMSEDLIPLLVTESASLSRTPPPLPPRRKHVRYTPHPAALHSARLQCETKLRL